MKNRCKYRFLLNVQTSYFFLRYAPYLSASLIEPNTFSGVTGIGSQKIVSLDKGETRRVELTSQEELNASLCKWNEESGTWGAYQDISGVSPGDYLLWDTSLHWTRYTP